MSSTHPVASMDKDTFLLLHGDRIGKSFLLLAYTHTRTHTQAHTVQKLFEELVVLLLNEL